MPVQTSQAQKLPLPIQSLAAKAVDKYCPSVETSSKAGPGQDRGERCIWKKKCPDSEEGTVTTQSHLLHLFQCCISRGKGTGHFKATSIAYSFVVISLPHRLLKRFIKLTPQRTSHRSLPSKSLPCLRASSVNTPSLFSKQPEGRLGRRRGRQLFLLES